MPLKAIPANLRLVVSCVVFTVIFIWIQNDVCRHKITLYQATSQRHIDSDVQNTMHPHSHHPSKLFAKVSKEEERKPLQFKKDVVLVEGSKGTSLKSGCEPKMNIAFLKTHKTAGSTITNLIQRYGYFKNLTFVLPLKNVSQYRFNYIGKDGESITHDNIIPKREIEEYNVLCNHVIYNEVAFQDILPDDTFLFTILREPLKQFVSTVNYYGYSKKGYLGKILNQSVPNPLSTYLLSPWLFEPKDPYFSMTNNRMSIDLGMPTNHIRNGSIIKSYIKMLKQRFKLVLIQEYFDESLILLKRYTCLTFKDIIYTSKNVWPMRQDFKMSADDVDKHRKWNRADYTLYETFFHIFWTKILKEKDFFEEVYHFKRVKTKVKLFCSVNRHLNKLSIFQSKWSPGFTLTPDDCYYIRMNEATFFALIRERMISRLHQNGNFKVDQNKKKHEDLTHLFN